MVVELAVIVDVEFFGLEDGSINGGSGYYAPAGGTQVYNNVDLQNGSGSAATNLTVENGAVGPLLKSLSMEQVMSRAMC